MNGFHKPTVMTVAIVVIVIVVGYHFLSKRSASKAAQ